MIILSFPYMFKYKRLIQKYMYTHLTSINIFYEYCRFCVTSYYEKNIISITSLLGKHVPVQITLEI